MRTTSVKGTGFKAVDMAALVGAKLDTLPYSLRILAENAARHSPQGAAASDVVLRNGSAVPFRPARLLLHDMLGIPALVDIMALRSKLADRGKDPTVVDMSLPVDLVIDHAMTINHWAERFALEKNMRREFEVNRERFAFLKACEARFPNLRIIPPGGGICHQVNLEFLSSAVLPSFDDPTLLIPDSCLGTDSHTPMVNGIGVAGWGIGGLEAEGLLFGEATSVNVPKVIGLEIVGEPSHLITATDIALVITERLREKGVVDTFVELFGEGYKHLSVEDRATIANMAPEYGTTMVYCPIDDNTLRYLRQTGRTKEAVARVDIYAKQQRFWIEGSGSRIDYDDVVTIDLSSVGRSVAGPARPEQRIELSAAARTLATPAELGSTPQRVKIDDTGRDLGDGDVIIAAITSCTNTCNPRNMVLAGLLARNAVRLGLSTAPHVKTSLSPGSRVVAHYLRESGLQDAFDSLGFEITAFSCSTCNGMSGPLRPEYEKAISDHDINAVAVLSGNRNFAGRIHPQAARNVIAAPPLVVAYALLGTVLKDVTTEPLGYNENGEPIGLSDLWPDNREVDNIIETYVTPDTFISNFNAIADVNEDWTALRTDSGAYKWAPSTYVSFPPFVDAIEEQQLQSMGLTSLRPLVILGDSVTTDHISPSGTITEESEAGQYLTSQGVIPADFNSFGTRRGCSDVVIRSTFANYRLQNEMTPGTEGSVTRIEPGGKVVSIFKAIEHYKEIGQSLIVIGGKEYGCGSSRDTAAKAPWLAGVKAVIAESFERIHRSNLVNMGIAPLCFEKGTTRKSLDLNGSEVFDIQFSEDFRAAVAIVHRSDGTSVELPLQLRIYNDREREIFSHGGLLPMAFRSFAEAAA